MCLSSKQKTVRTIGKWYIGELLGKGSYSWVKKGIDKKNGTCVALKFMAKTDESWANEPVKYKIWAKIQQVVTTIESLKQIQHPNVIKLHACNLNARYPTKMNEKIDTILLVFEFAPFGEIFDILHYNAALDPILSRSYLSQIVFGLEALHAKGIAHGDIKPSNLLFDSKLNIKLANSGLSQIFCPSLDTVKQLQYLAVFGYVRKLSLIHIDYSKIPVDIVKLCALFYTVDSETILPDKITAGNDWYTAPEILLNRPYNLSCDIFSTGIILFILLNGYPPFERTHYSDRWFRPLAKGDYAKFWKYHAGCAVSNDSKCKDLLEKMLCYDPKQRITIAQIKQHPWFNDERLEGKELVLAVRDRHRTREAKRRRDARKIKDLRVSVYRRGIDLYRMGIVPKWDRSLPEPVLSNIYTHFKEPCEFFHLLSGLIHDTYHGQAKYEPSRGTMICTISKLEKSTATPNTKGIMRNYKFEISLFKSRRYAKDDTTNKENVYVIRTKRLQGDSYRFCGMRTKILRDGAQTFCGLPEWALLQDDQTEDVLDNDNDTID